MTATLLDSFRSLLTPDAVSSVASRFGESETSVSRGLTSSFGSILLGLLNRAHDPGAIREIHGLVTQASADTAVPNSDGPGSILKGGSSGNAALGNRLLAMILGGNSSPVADAIGRSSGLSPSVASSLLSMVAPMVLGILGRRIRTDGLSASGLGSLLAIEADSIRSAAPAGIASLLGTGAPTATPSTRRATMAADATRSGGMGWAWLAVAAAVILGIIWFASRAGGPAANQVAMDTTMAPAARAADSADVQAYSPSGSITLPTGATLKVPEGGLESQIVAFIRDSSAAVDKTTWFNFDRLLFETGSARLAPKSSAQLQNVAAIFAAYPKVHAKIGGYTDNTGDAKANQTLSQDRAKSVMDQLVSLGIDKARLEAEGYGDQHPVADNATEAGRAQYRRIALIITEK
jgi:outer membrane protein OmpA-like peptidoglycan-associated protein